MGIISQGILGGISGKVGNVVGASWKGIHYLRIKPASVANPRTIKQVNQRNRFSAVVDFLSPSLAFLQVGYKFYQSKKSAYNAATSYVLKNAITGTAPDFEVDYANALVSRGSLTGAGSPGVTVSAGLATLTWLATPTGNASATDEAMALVYNVTKKAAIVVIDGSATRANAELEVTIPAEYTGDTMEVYLAFQSADGSAVSNSVHLGSVIGV